MIKVETTPTTGATIHVDQYGIDELRDALDEAEKGNKVILGESAGWLAVRPVGWT